MPVEVVLHKIQDNLDWLFLRNNRFFMLRLLLHLSPVYVTIFWTIILNGQRNTHSAPRSFLAKFMFILVIVNLAQFFQHEELHQLYLYLDIFYLYAGTLAFPFYHIYFRLLTVDEKFSWKAHYKFLILPFVLITSYVVVLLFTPYDEYKVWLFNRNAFLNVPQIRIIKIIRIGILIFTEVLVIYYLIKSTILLRKYSNRAEQFYSNMEDGKYNNAKMLNFMILTNCLLNVICAIDFINYTTTKLIVYSVLFAIDYYMIGYMGNRLKAINPTFEQQLDSPAEETFGTDLSPDQKKTHNRLLSEFDKNKIYLNSELTILDVVKLIGTNRTYISSLINQEYNQNFCSFVNSYRIDELERIIHEDYLAVNEVLAEKAGFGSVKSMKRAISAKTGLSLSDWRKQIAKSENRPNSSLNQ
jgi:AraC-like DNA-binding protein